MTNDIQSVKFQHIFRILGALFGLIRNPCSVSKITIAYESENKTIDGTIYN